MTPATTPTILVLDGDAEDRARIRDALGGEFETLGAEQSRVVKEPLLQIENDVRSGTVDNYSEALLGFSTGLTVQTVALETVSTVEQVVAVLGPEIVDRRDAFHGSRWPHILGRVAAAALARLREVLGERVTASRLADANSGTTGRAVLEVEDADVHVSLGGVDLRGGSVRGVDAGGLGVGSLGRFCSTHAATSVARPCRLVT